MTYFQSDISPYLPAILLLKRKAVFQNIGDSELRIKEYACNLDSDDQSGGPSHNRLYKKHSAGFRPLSYLVGGDALAEMRVLLLQQK